MADSTVNDVSHLVEVIYTRFILRDLIGKVVPGAIVLVGMVTALYGWITVHEWMGHLTGVQVILLAALCWLATISLQWLGELALPWVVYGWMVPKWFHHRPVEDAALQGFKDNRKALNDFLEVAEPDHQAIYERFVVIREAAGNSSTAILLILLPWLGRTIHAHVHSKPMHITDYPQAGQQLSLWCCAAVAAFSLRAMYFEHRHRQKEYAALTVLHPPKPKTPSSA